MRSEKFVDFLNRPEKLNTATASYFRKLAGQYPYCQPLRFVLAKNLQLFKSSDYELHVNQAAAMAYERRMFQSYMAGRNPLKTEGPASQGFGVKKKSSLWPLWLNELLGQKKQKTPTVANTTKNSQVVAAEQLPKVKSDPSLKAPYPESKPEPNTETYSRKRNFDHLIQKFITENPRIGAYNPNIPSDNLAEKNLIQPEEIGTETLAAIYERQGFKAKAIAVYEKLSLKYPEKSSYFAQKISSLKNN